MKTKARGNSIQNVLDRIVAGPAEELVTKFYPASTWQGRKPGYYFGTGDSGTGYYHDMNNNNQRKRKRTVKIEESKNELVLLPRSLLEQAEKMASGSIVMELTPKGIQSAANALEKITRRNALRRAEFCDDPQHFLDSELALHDQLKSLGAVAANGHLYKNLVENEILMSTLNQLLGHDNADIASLVIALYLEWLDPSLLGDDPSFTHAMKSLASKILREAWEPIVSNLTRFSQNGPANNETQDQALKSIENCLFLMENILELDRLIPEGLIGSDKEGLSASAFMVSETKILPWLFLQVDNELASMATRGRCMELIASMAQDEDCHKVLPDWSNIPGYISDSITLDNPSFPELKGTMNAIESLLQIIGSYRKSQPNNATETELLENASLILSSCLTFSPLNLTAFLEGQGIELVMRCLKERVHSGGSCLKLLDFFGFEEGHKRACEHLVDVGGLKYLFPVFLGARIPKPAQSHALTKKEKREWKSAVEVNSIRVMYALSLNLDTSSPSDAQARFLAKFVQDSTKCDRLIELLLLYDEKARNAEFKFFRSDVEENVGVEETIQLAALDAKLRGGGDIFHRLGAIAAHVALHSKRCHQRIVDQLKLQQSGISLIKVALKEHISLLGEGPQQRKLQAYLDRL